MRKICKFLTILIECVNLRKIINKKKNFGLKFRNLKWEKSFSRVFDLANLETNVP